MRKVVKFGGSSLASAEQFKKVGDIIRADKGRKYVVPSAPGKRFDGDIKVTDMLYACYAKAEKKEDITASIAAIPLSQSTKRSVPANCSTIDGLIPYPSL